MKKTLYMHFRTYKRNRNKLDNTLVDTNGNVTILEAEARGGVTVAGLLSDDKSNIIWGAVKCYGVNYDKRIGITEASNVAFDGVSSKNVDYEQAKDYAVALGHLVYEKGVTIGMEKFEKILEEDGNLV